MAITLVSRNVTTPTLQSDTSWNSAAQTHVAGNLLVATIIHGLGSLGYLTTITNTAGDTWVSSANTPFYAAGVTNGSTFEMWYVLSTKGAANDVLNVFFDGHAGMTAFSMGVFEFNSGSGGPAFTYGGADASAGIEVDPTNQIVSPPLSVSAPAVVLGVYRNSNVTVPTNPSGIQVSQVNTNDSFPGAHYNSYKITNVGGRVTATIPQPPINANWAILATSFVGGVNSPPGAPCTSIT